MTICKSHLPLQSSNIRTNKRTRDASHLSFALLVTSLPKHALMQAWCTLRKPSDSAYTRKSPALSVRLCRGRMFTRFHLACSVRLSQRRNHSFDCNVSQRTVLRSLGAGFQMFPAKALSPQGASLCCVPHPTLLVDVLFSILFPKSYPYSMPGNPKSKV